ncbi:hypothetical protein VNO77_42960 [Canavalia gladiata]|uniref:Uncharacterized protein n=1 Tax=Canavalia gladiata TaxID=3824 RepID=A0AAN9PNY1_CANGL
MKHMEKLEHGLSLFTNKDSLRVMAIIDEDLTSPKSGTKEVALIRQGMLQPHEDICSLSGIDQEDANNISFKVWKDCLICLVGFFSTITWTMSYSVHAIPWLTFM